MNWNPADGNFAVVRLKAGSAAEERAKAWEMRTPEANYYELTCVEARRNGERTVASVERVLRKAGVLEALGRTKWMP